MKILYISFYYPPFNSIGAVRASKTVKYLTFLGHEVCVLSADSQLLPTTLKDENVSVSVNYTSWININLIVALMSGGRQKVGVNGYPSFSKRFNILNKLGYLYKLILNFPDAQIGWWPFAVSRGKKILREAEFDVIYASAWPVTSLLIARKLSKISGVPWVCEYRDLWTKNPYLSSPVWKKNIEKSLEMSVLKSSSGLVTISEPHARQMKEDYHKPIAVVSNGFDPEEHDFTEVSEITSSVCKIVHAGTIYPGKRSPEPLFKALANLAEKKKKFKLIFMGRYSETLAPLIPKYGLEDIVELHGQVSRKEAIIEQSKANVLLLLLWDSPEEEGNYSGKFFDYLGSRRPILLLGPKKNVAAQIIENLNLGCVTTAQDQIEKFLLSQLSKSGSDKYLTAVKKADLSNFTRKSQTKILSKFLCEVINQIPKK